MPPRWLSFLCQLPEEFTELECTVVDVDIVDGLATANAAAVQTKELAIGAVGTIDFGTEAVDLSFRTKVREGIGISVSSLVNPFVKVGGTLGEPKMQLDTKRGILSGSVAVLTGGLSILAKGAWDSYLSSDKLCDEVLEALESGALVSDSN